MSSAASLDLQPVFSASTAAFAKYAELVQSYATETVLDLMFLDVAPVKGPAPKEFDASNWALRSLYTDPEHAFKPIVPFKSGAGPLQTYYNDLYGILFARESDEFKTTDLTLSETAVKWAV
jgi:hypothetical protein